MENNIENTITCPCCGAPDCYKESMDGIDSYLCMGCGYTSTSKNIDGSIPLRKWESTTPELIKKSKIVDSSNIAWYPSIMNLPSIGIIFPDGTNETEWGWRVAKVVEIPEADRSKFPIPNKPGEYYATKLDMKNSKIFAKSEFKAACVELGILKPAL